MDMAPYRIQLQNMSQKNKEFFKEYTQRWRELASQVKPPLAKKELTKLFIDTMQPSFCEKMVGSTSLGFYEKIVNVVGTSNNNKNKFQGGFKNNKECETNVVSSGQRRTHSRRK